MRAYTKKRRIHDNSEVDYVDGSTEESVVVVTLPVTVARASIKVDNNVGIFLQEFGLRSTLK